MVVVERPAEKQAIQHGSLITKRETTPIRSRPLQDAVFNGAVFNSVPVPKKDHLTTHASTDVTGVNMALEPGAYRELHWHKEAEWGSVLVGRCRVTAIDEHGRSFIDDVKAGRSVELRGRAPALDPGARGVASSSCWS